MNIVVEKQPKCLAILSVQVPAEKVQGEREKILRSYATHAKIQGFRPGKAPKQVIEKKFQKEIAEQLEDDLLNLAYEAAISQEKLKVLDIDRPQSKSFDQGGNFSFTAQLILAPEITLADYNDLSVTLPSADVPADALDAQLKILQEKLAAYVTIEDRAADWGNLASINYTSTCEGKPMDDYLGRPSGFLSGREGHWVKLHEDGFLPGFVAQAIGMQIGEQKIITVTIADDFGIPELCGKDVIFDTTLNELKQVILPELDDEFAKKLAPHMSLEEIKEAITRDLAEQRKRKIDDLKIELILTQLRAKMPVELPENLVAQETQNQIDQMVDNAVRSGVSNELIAAQQQEIFSRAEESAKGQLHANFILQEIAYKENLQVSDNELVKYLSLIANDRQVQPKKFIRDAQKSGRLPSIRNSLMIGKAIDYLIEHTKVIESNDVQLNA